MAELAEFSVDSFDAAAWINQAINQKPDSASEEPIERFLAELEMRLQLAAEEIESSLQDSSLQAMRRIPFAVQEIYRLQGDIQGMQDQVQALSKSVRSDATFAGESVSSLAELDRVRGNMENACNTLKEATELSGLFIKVEEVFEAGDLPRVAEILSSMRRSLSLVGDVPEFRAGKQRLMALEDRMQGLIEGSLEDALSGTDEELVRKLCHLLLAVGRFQTVEQRYCASRLALVHQIWEELAGQAKSEASDMMIWLPQFYDRLLALMKAEHEWCKRVLPSHQVQLCASLSSAVFEKVAKGTSTRLSQRFAPQSATVNSITALIALLRDVTTMGRSVAELLKDLPTEKRTEVLQLLYRPVEEKISDYGSLERTILHGDLIRSLPDEPLSAASADSGEDTDGEVKVLAAASKTCFQLLRASLDRCLGLTGGSELLDLVSAVDQEMTMFVSRMQGRVSQLQERQSAKLIGGVADGSTDGAGGSISEEEISSTLKLVLVASELSDGLNKLEAQFRTTISNTVPKLEGITASANSSPADPLVLRLRGDPARMQRLSRLLTNLQEPRFMTFPGAAVQVDGFTKDVHSIVFDALFCKIKLHLKGLPDLQEWRRAGAAGAAAGFNAYPSAYVTAIGEYLMTMPQQLEVLMSEEDEENEESGPGGSDAEELAAEWLDRIVSGAGALYADEALKIRELSPSGGIQLAADIEYFCNVMSALHVMPPASLLTFQLFAGHAANEFADAAAAAKAEGGADASVLNALGQMKKVSI